MKKLLLVTLLFLSFIGVGFAAEPEDSAVKQETSSIEQNSAQVENATVNGVEEIQTEIPLNDNRGNNEDFLSDKKPMFSFYVGGGFILASDTTFFDFDVQKMVNPLLVLDYAGYNAQIGFVPLNNVTILRFFRGEIETMYMRSAYSNIQNLELNPDADPLTQGPGRITLKKSLMYNFYLDFKTFSDRMYPYVGYGFGAGRVDISKVDTSEIADNPGFTGCPVPDVDTGECNGQGLGEDWTATPKSVALNQFMVGFVYQVPRLKSSFNVEYRYLTSGNIEVQALNNDIYGKKMDVKYQYHSLVFGVKYFFR